MLISKNLTVKVASYLGLAGSPYWATPKNSMEV
jgi:hypothetical protein